MRGYFTLRQLPVVSLPIRLLGYRWAVVIGAAIMTLGHASMAIETEFSLYFGLALLVIGTGFFKPNITSIISEMYDGKPDKKDGAYTIFYMGVNAGAFFGMMLCGYLAERVGWSWGFGLAGIFMFLGTLQFWLAKPLFGNIGGVPDKAKLAEEKAKEEAVWSKRPYSQSIYPFLTKFLFLLLQLLVCYTLINDPGFQDCRSQSAAGSNAIRF